MRLRSLVHHRSHIEANSRRYSLDNVCFVSDLKHGTSAQKRCVNL
jgi:hypothetical protein